MHDDSPPYVFEPPDIGVYGCCYGWVSGDHSDCKCWEPIFELGHEQQEPQLDGLPSIAPEPCVTCAFRRGTWAWRARIAEDIDCNASNFWCHQGIARVVGYRHPSGVSVMTPPHDYGHGVGDRLYRADGRVADLCAGWARRNPEDAARHQRGERAAGLRIHGL